MKYFWKWAELWLTTDKPLGSASLKRADMQELYNGQQFWVTSFDGSQLDCMFIKSRTNSTEFLRD
jgi:hypothetical protein